MKDNQYWNSRIDDLKERFKLNTDVKTARLLSVSPTMLANVRSGHTPIPIGLKFTILDKLGYLWTRERLLLLVPPDIRERVVRANNQFVDIQLSKKDKALTAKETRTREEIEDERENVQLRQLLRPR